VPGTTGLSQASIDSIDVLYEQNCLHAHLDSAAAIDLARSGVIAKRTTAPSSSEIVRAALLSLRSIATNGTSALVRPVVSIEGVQMGSTLFT
jgi:hypothetical protein